MSTSIRKLSVIDSAFLFVETAECPMHVGSMAILKLPDGYDGDYFESLKSLFGQRLHLAKMLTYKLAQTPFDIDRPSWVRDDDFDLNRHMMRVAIPAPADRKTLQRLIGWLHAKPLNRARPLWECYVFEGLPDNEVAIYTKMHHSLIDGGAGAALSELLYDLSPTPRKVAQPSEAAKAAENGNGTSDVRDIATSLIAAYTQLLRMPLRAPGSKLEIDLPRTGGTDLASVMVDAGLHSIEWPLKLMNNFPEVAKTIGQVMQAALKPDSLKTLQLLGAPATPLNVQISAERSFAAVSIPLARVKAVAKAANAKVNDIVLAMSSGVLRRYLLEIGKLPKKSLTAFVPISAREEGNRELRNQVFGMVTALGTDIADPADRLREIIEQSNHSKELANPFKPLIPHLAEVPTFGTPMLFQLLATFYARANLANYTPPPVNVVISNVFFSKYPLYMAGAALQNIYPLSIPVHGQALNITVQGYKDNLDFGLIAGANVLPHLEFIGEMLPGELVALEKAFGIAA